MHDVALSLLFRRDKVQKLRITFLRTGLSRFTSSAQENRRGSTGTMVATLSRDIIIPWIPFYLDNTRGKDEHRRTVNSAELADQASNTI